MPPELAEVRQWIRKAHHDWRAARTLLAQSPPITDVAGFHCQQAAEKLLKAFLVWRGAEFEKIHDLRALVLSCAELEPALRGFRDRVGPLTGFAVRYRYPGPGDPSEDQIKEALNVVRAIAEFLADRMPPELRVDAEDNES